MQSDILAHLKLLKSTVNSLTEEEFVLSLKEFNSLCDDEVYKQNILLGLKDILIISSKIQEKLVRKG